jgi:hypothetical protein
MQPDLVVSNLPVAGLIPYAENARTHSPAQVTQIAASIAEFGFVNPVLVDAEGALIAGHGRVMAAKQLGLATVPVLRLGHLSPAQARALRLADNQIALNSGWDEALLAAEIARIRDEAVVDLDVLGFSGMELDRLLAAADAGLGEDADDAPPPPVVFVRVFDGAANVRENIAGDVLASGTTMQWNSPAKGWNAGAVMADASLNRRQTIRVGAGVAFAQIGIVGFDGQIELEALRLFGLPETAPAVLYACPSVPIGTRSLALETTWDLPSLTAGATANIDVTVPGARRGDFADASLDTSSIAFVLDCHVWSNNSVRVTARNVSASTVDLAAAPLAVQVTKRRLA